MKIGDFGFPVYQKTDSADKVNQMVKSEPYITGHPDDLIENYNGKLVFPDSESSKIVCRHLAAQYALDVLSNEERGKVKMKDYSNEESICGHVSKDTERYFHDVFSKSQTVYLINNNDFGSALIDNFQVMERNGETHRALLLSTHHHVMAVRLNIKETSKRYYVINFYDPNVTDHTLRCKVDDLALLKSHTLESYVNIGYYYIYYNNNDDYKIMQLYVCENPGILSERTINNERKLTPLKGTEPPSLSSYLLCKLLQNRYFIEVEKRINEMISQPLMSSDDIYHLLKYCDPLFGPPLFFALTQDQFLMVAVLGKLIKLLPEEQRKALLDTTNSQGAPGLFIALKEGNVRSIAAYGKLLDLITDDDRAELLDIDNVTEQHYFFLILKHGNMNTFAASVELMKHLSASETEKFMAVKDKNGTQLLSLYAQRYIREVE
ncbi:TPA: ShET2/EspL2 family type III secretion system effector toxin [Yersinia enterocolitica]|uniref:ShET2/EspL2 family type III secretion system effector toxin n=1 Tax=Yersinia enterocolitica TaxID=630 RepID=UPI0005E0910F|nr:ShET2/EspL2 family type III secretion system effector toxin [Yersinia enterocolitica]EKN3777930.1 ShET2/EspL2 family type III secretion system effector toxin [Yersinia enterocolitica]EKN4010287.1 ShET2/EspL2 family type III secretion system effector toxin [Yersinia enterocolitica]EKN6001734.1 ShET2/EspL2 family type III secretion system effector toxin [Yersinia enterocolitica]EKN6040743.1 ShET2/EspL2 family type III secretion system effector toxin [Yersinia enterocolitica]EKN6371411.1 ShET2